MKKFICGLSLVLVLVVLSACARVGDSDDRLSVVATTGMIADVVENVAGEFIAVRALMGPGVDPHLYQPSAQDIRLLENADIIIYNGLYLEGKMVEVFESLRDRKSVLALAEVIREDRLLEWEEDEEDDEVEFGEYDPHVWFDVSLWAETVDLVVETLSSMDEVNADFYAKNGVLYKQELLELHEFVLSQVALIPANHRVLVTAHDAFGYFGNAYGVEVLGIQGISTEADYGVKDLEELIDLIVEREIKAIFIESTVPPRSINALREGVLARGHAVEIGGELFGDAMGAKGTPEGTYVGMVKHNLNTIVNALK